MPGIEDIIAQTVEAAESTGNVPDPVETPEGNEPAEEPADNEPEAEVTEEEPTVESPEEPAAEPAKPGEKPEDKPKDELTKELEALGVKAPVAGERENRIPYARVRKIVENAQKKVRTTYEAKVTEYEGKLKSNEAELTDYRRADELIKADPDRYMAVLALMHPQYKKFIDAVAGAKPASVEPDRPASDFNEPEPGPDLRFPDGTLAYSAEQQKLHATWQAKQIRAQVNAEMKGELDKRLGPVERERQAIALREAERPKVQAAIRAASARWGKIFDEDYAKGDKSEVLAYIRQNPNIPYPQAVADVLLPKLQAQNAVDRTAMRSEIMKELNAKKPAARTTTGGSTAEGVRKPVSNGPQKLEDVIAASIENAGLR